jgi:murein L,D-transpeptidase YafK
LRAALALAVATLVLGVAPATTAKISPAPREARDSAETLLKKAIDDIGRQHFDAALGQIENLIRLQPNFRLAHLIKGDLLLAKVRPLSTLGGAPGGNSEKIVDLREEAIARLRALRDRPNGDRVPRYLLQLRPEQKYAVVVDTGRSRLYLYGNEDGALRLIGDYYISSGKAGTQKTREGDQKTPIGVYTVTSSLPRAKLKDFYGSGAYPISYPNEWDRRMGRKGHGIWLHGTPSDTYSRPPRASDGCVVLANTDLESLATDLQIGITPVIISEAVEWVSPEALKSERKSFDAQLESWRSDWESRDTGRYMSHYSRKFSAGHEDFDGWRKHKGQVNGNKAWIKVQLANVSVFRDPGEKDMMVVTFEQHYQSSNYSNVTKKRQYWRNEGDRWKIIYEGSA